jgi:hypothetical protein
VQLPSLDPEPGRVLVYSLGFDTPSARMEALLSPDERSRARRFRRDAATPIADVSF